MEHRQAAKSSQSTQVQPSAINSRASPLPRSTNHLRCPGQTPAARHIVRTAVSVRPNRTLRSARKSSRHTCGKLRERLSFYYLSPNCVAPLKPMPKPMPSCTSQNRQLIFRQNALAEISRAMLPAHQQTQLPCATDCKTPKAITLHHCVQAVARNYLHPPQWAQPASNPSFCARAHTGIRK